MVREPRTPKTVPNARASTLHSVRWLVLLPNDEHRFALLPRVLALRNCRPIAGAELQHGPLPSPRAQYPFTFGGPWTPPRVSASMQHICIEKLSMWLDFANASATERDDPPIAIGTDGTFSPTSRNADSRTRAGSRLQSAECTRPHPLSCHGTLNMRRMSCVWSARN